jgi:para-nitrobenzyl esterase
MKKTGLAISVILLLIGFYGCKPNSPVNTAKVEGGMVEGVVSGDIAVFKGIPYAAPPVGDLRWKPPQPVKAWTGVLRADKFGPMCPQPGVQSNDSTALKPSEDCLYLNVWTPAKSRKEMLPVMVWIYGGGFSSGATSVPWYNGENLAKRGVIVVSVGYRVGPLGFLPHPELDAESANHVSGNYGLLDQIEGLKWVQNNISAFGGDPKRVTIFGESAGAISVSMLCASPLTKGLFWGAISESGSSFFPVTDSLNVFDCVVTLAGAEKRGIEFMKRMGCSNIAELRKVPPEKWMNDPASQMGYFWPVVDGYVIAGDQTSLYNEGRYNDVHVIIGTNSDEGSMFVRNQKPEEYIKGVKMRFGPFAERILKLYPVDSTGGTYRSAADIFRDVEFAWTGRTWARLQEKTGKSKVFVYYFDQFRNEPFWPGMPMPDGAAHASEIVYVFGTLDLNYGANITPEEKGLSETMEKYWTNFARTGDPNGEGLPVWPVYRDDGKTVMYLKGTPETIGVPNLEKLNLVDEYFDWRRSNTK